MNALRIILTALAVLIAGQPLYLFAEAAYQLQFWSALAFCAFAALILVAGAVHFVWEEWR